MNQIQIAAKMYDCRDTAKKFYKDEYDKKIKWYVDILKAIMLTENLDELKAFLFVSELEHIKDEGTALMFFAAATVELIENEKQLSIS